MYFASWESLVSRSRGYLFSNIQQHFLNIVLKLWACCLIIKKNSLFKSKWYFPWPMASWHTSLHIYLSVMWYLPHRSLPIIRCFWHAAVKNFCTLHKVCTVRAVGMQYRLRHTRSAVWGCVVQAEGNSLFRIFQPVLYNLSLYCTPPACTAHTQSVMHMLHTWFSAGCSEGSQNACLRGVRKPHARPSEFQSEGLLNYLGASFTSRERGEGELCGIFKGLWLLPLVLNFRE